MDYQYIIAGVVLLGGMTAAVIILWIISLKARPIYQHSFFSGRT